ncbi:GxxExxY protein [Belliella kenyensis]|uniref:GxxExxY protein n=1 Tax=Belliella kenyensis TaxID=1472724 RepID=A0ABV8EJ72_9BACT|nr:GxxExxY protein [Belliella kenyensis]MCH7402463.1 GxxExxY protein [Belliella kenyensis]MDN3603654.1 GxxExxY protein [Belliella kenyensis]
MTENQISRVVIGKAIFIHRKLGPGLLESAYEKILAYELQKEGFDVKCQVLLPIEWEGMPIEKAYRVDILVENKVIVELKCVEEVSNVHFSQLLTYLKFSELKLGLIINFKTVLLKNGLHRVVNGLKDDFER